MSDSTKKQELAEAVQQKRVCPSCARALVPPYQGCADVLVHPMPWCMGWRRLVNAEPLAEPREAQGEKGKPERVALIAGPGAGKLAGEVIAKLAAQPGAALSEAGAEPQELRLPPPHKTDTKLYDGEPLQFRRIENTGGRAHVPAEHVLTTPSRESREELAKQLAHVPWDELLETEKEQCLHIADIVKQREAELRQWITDLLDKLRNKREFWQKCTERAESQLTAARQLLDNLRFEMNEGASDDELLETAIDLKADSHELAEIKPQLAAARQRIGELERELNYIKTGDNQ